MKGMNYAKLYTKRSDGRYQGYWKDADGKRHAICDRDPERLYHRIEEKTQPETITFGVIAQHWYKESQDILKPGSWAMYDAPYKRATDRMGDVPAAEINSADIAQHLADMAAQGYGERTLKAQRTVYSLVYKFAAQKREYADEIHYNPAAMAQLPHKRKRPAKRQAPDEDAIVSIVLGVNAPFGLFPYLLLCTGLRRGEALGLQWKDVDFRRNSISVNRGVTYRKGGVEVGDLKTEGSCRSVPLMPMLRVVLEAAKPKSSDSKEEYIFHGEDASKPMCEATYRRRWHNWCRSNGFAYQIEDGRTKKRGLTHYKWEYTLTAHVLRHGYASLSKWGGLDTSVIKDLLGHENLRTTERYIHGMPDAADRGFSEAASKIEYEINTIIARASALNPSSLDGNSDGKISSSLDL